jgi:hypothetical protein
VFDRNGNGTVDLNEWKAPFGELAPGGEAVKVCVRGQGCPDRVTVQWGRALGEWLLPEDTRP